jgi:conjugative relaxase-like TrwC/TraI family protein
LAVVATIAKGYDLGYIWKTQDHAAGRTTGGYYIDAAQAGEPPGRWWGPGAQALGLAPGQTVDRKPYDAIYRQTDPRTGARLGRARGRYPTFADHLARLAAAEPHATAERLIELEREAARATRQPAAYYDVTISFSKSISILHASIRENERRARLAGDQQVAVYWAGREQQFQEVLHRANRAALEYLQAWAGITRTGYHGTRVDGREPGRFESAGLVVTSWLQGTSREGDPQDHIHNQIARIVRTYRDGNWRALDTMSVRGVLGALQAVAATSVECELAREFGVDWVPRADGRGNEIRGVTQAQLDAYSTRTVQVRAKERELARAWERKHGRAPTSRELLHIANAATLQSRKGKDAAVIDWDALARRWDATLGGDLAGIAPAVSDARGPGARAGEHHAGRAPSGPPAREVQERALAKALVLVSAQHPAWTRHDLIKQLALVLPAESRQMSPEEARELLLGLAEEALSGRSGEVVCLEAPEWPPLPASLRRDLDGRSVYSRPGIARYATAAQLSLEDRLVAHAQAQGAPRVRGELAARRLGADLAQLRAALADRAHDPREHHAPRGLRLDQAAAAWYALTSARTVEVITGPAGTGKTRVLATAARIWDGPVVGTATSQNATNELRAAGIQVTANTTRLLADLNEGRILPGSLILADEGSMIPITHLAAITEYVARNRCKLILAGDQEQLAAVEGGGAMMLLAEQLGYVQLAEPVRFAAAWERAASLRLRGGDATALDEYDQNGRIRGARPDQAMDQAARAYAATYLTGRNVLLMAADWARCRELSARIRDDLIHLGLVDAGREMYGYDHPGDPIGPEPSHETPDQRAAWHQASAALGPASQPDIRTMPDGRLWLLRDSYAAQIAWAPQYVGKELRLSRLGAFDAALGVIRADAEADAARKTGDYDRAGRHEQLAASYRALRDHYQQRGHDLAQAMAERHEWEHGTERSRRLAIAADTELRRRHPYRKIEPLRSAEPTPAIDAERQHPDLTPQQGSTETAQIGELKVQRQAFRAAMNEQRQRVPGEDATRANPGEASPASRTPRRDAILQPPKPQITPTPEILQRAAERDIEPEAGG